MLYKIFAIVNAVLVLLFSIGGYFIVPQFEELFRGFGANLPALTIFVLESYRYWAVLLIVPLFILAKYPTGWELPVKTTNRLATINIVMFIFLLIFMPLMLLAMYLPIFEMGSKVNG